MRDLYYYTLYISYEYNTTLYSPTCSNSTSTRKHQQQQEQQRILKFLHDEKQRYKHFLEWKAGKNLNKKIMDQYFGNKFENEKIIDPITLETIKLEEGILLGNYIFQSISARGIMGKDRETALSLTTPGSVDE